MPLKNKTRSKPALPAVKFCIRRIANRNPRNIRGFLAGESRFKRAFAGFLIVLALLILALAGSISQDNKNLQASVVAAETGNTSCVAANTATNLATLRAQKIKLAERYVSYFQDSTWDKIPATATELQNLNTSIAALEKQFGEDRNITAISIARLENEVLFCADAESCAKAEQDLTATQDCEKQVRNTVIALEEQSKVLTKYRFRDSQNNLVGKAEIQKLFIALNQYRAKTDSQQNLLEKCLMDNIYQDAPCAKRKSDFVAARDAEGKQLEKIANLAASLEATTKNLDNNITALKFAQSNKEDLTPAQGLGWCQKTLADASATLNAKVSESAELKAVYSDALQRLDDVKKELTDHLVEAAKQATATTSQLNFVFKAVTTLKIFSGIF